MRIDDDDQNDHRITIKERKREREIFENFLHTSYQLTNKLFTAIKEEML